MHKNIVKKVFVSIKPEYMTKYFCIAIGCVVVSMLLDIAYGKDIWVEEDTSPPLEGNPAFYSNDKPVVEEE